MTSVDRFNPSELLVQVLGVERYIIRQRYHVACRHC